MQDTAKYLIHADITADGVVERSDVVGAVFGQTEGLLGDDLDLRDLQDSSKVGRIDVDIASENGQSFGEITIATSLDKVETAILAAALETIDRVGPCESTIDVDSIEDVRAAKRRQVVERAKTLLAEAFDGSILSSQELVEEVRRAIRVEDITEYEGYPAGPRVADSDAIIIVEGRADVLQLLKYGIKTAVAVEGTNIPEAVAKLTGERTVTAFLDGDRGGDLILKELAQVGDIDYVAFAPRNRSVEDLDRHEVMAALRDKVSYDAVVSAETPREAVAATDGSTTPAPVESRDPAGEPTSTRTPEESVVDAVGEATEVEVTEADESDGETTAESTAEDSESASVDREPKTLHGHVAAVIDDGTGRVRLLSETFDTLAEGDASEAFDLLRDADAVPAAVVLDGEVSQRLLDVAAQRGVDQVVAASEGEFVKKPTSVRVRTVDELREVADQ
ncbi:DNA primase DnaG [Halorarius litoreus]|uniref:DNA primase DnaG n=1 Tax=Halorarius litoreus TaxID=2962676 RepID=UPI0020CC6417|nr:DNA primase DnaG [Halorarius litoreus]